MKHIDRNTSTIFIAIIVAGMLSFAGCASSDDALSPEDSDSSGDTDADTDVDTDVDTDTDADSDTDTDSDTDADSDSDTDVTIDTDSDNLDADSPLIQLYGRWDTSDPKNPVGDWGPIYIQAKFEGTSLTIRMTDEQLTVPPDGVGTGNIYQYSIDGGAFTVLSSTSATEYPLATGLTDATHTVTFARRTESKFGKTTFHGFTLDAGKYLVEPDPRPARKVEVLGDSISAGLANENNGWYNNLAENGYMAFGPQTARLLDAEWRVEARGGGAFYDEYWLPMRGFFEKTFGPLELQHNPDADNPSWNFDSWQPDVFVLALGTNDYSVEGVPHIDETLYVGEYKEFLGKLRAWYPDAEIFALAPFKEGAPWDECRTYIATAVTEMADAKIHSINPVGNGTSDKWLTYPADYIPGDEYHPTIGGHTKIAAELSEIIAAQMGW